MYRTGAGEITAESAPRAAGRRCNGTRTREILRALGFIGPAAVFLGLVFVVPLLTILTYGLIDGGLTLHGFVALAGSRLFVRVLSNTLVVSVAATAISVMVGYPIALHLSRVTTRTRAILLAFVLIPFWVNSVVKSYAFVVLLGRNGVVNYGLQALFHNGGFTLLFNRTGVIVGLVHFLLPYVVLPVLSNLLSQSADLRRVAQAMGAGPVRIFFRITLPLSLPGVTTGVLMAFILALGTYVVPLVLGGRRDLMIANLIDQYARDLLDWGTAAALAAVFLVIALLAYGVISRYRESESLI